MVLPTNETLFALPFFQAVEVRGEDAAAFLHAQLSNHIEDLQDNEACYATYNTPKGRVIANMIVLHHQERFWLIMAADLVASVVKRLKMYVLRAKVVFEDTPKCHIGGSEEVAPAVADTRLKFAAQSGGVSKVAIPLSSGNTLIISAQPLSAQPEAAHEWYHREILAGMPWIAEATSETCVAQMLNQHIIGGVHFKKGCYPGQEIIARAQYRGQVKRGLALLSANVPLQAGDKVFHEGEEVGIVINAETNGARIDALAVIKFAAAEQTLSAHDAPLKQERLLFSLPEA